MCGTCLQYCVQLQPRIKICIYSTKPGKDYFRLNKKRSGCSRLYYNDKTGILKFNCRNFDAHRFWFPRDKHRESDFIFDSFKGGIIALFQSDKSESKIYNFYKNQA